MSEFELIAKYFIRPGKNVDLGVGDDGALVRVSNDVQLVISTDMSVAGTHFFAETSPYFVGWKSMAVNVSDMAAMGAQPKWATLAIALPEVDDAWLAEFSRGFFACADTFGVELIGGDTTRGPLNISITIMGEVPTDQALCRHGAQPQDEIWVSGRLGAAAFALAKLQHPKQFYYVDESELKELLPALHQPIPRLNLGLALRGIASSAIDISDGLLADLSHILQRSNVSARLIWENIPSVRLAGDHMYLNDLQQKALAGGDDYELCFTAPAHQHQTILNLSSILQLPISCIGHILQKDELSQSQCKVFMRDGTEIKLSHTGFNHF